MLDAAMTIGTYDDAMKNGAELHSVPPLSVEIYHANGGSVGRIPSDALPDIVAGYKAILTFNQVVSGVTPLPTEDAVLAAARRESLINYLPKLLAATREAVVEALRAGERHADMPDDLRRRVANVLRAGQAEGDRQ